MSKRTSRATQWTRFRNSGLASLCLGVKDRLGAQLRFERNDSSPGDFQGIARAAGRHRDSMETSPSAAPYPRGRGWRCRGAGEPGEGSFQGRLLGPGRKQEARPTPEGAGRRPGVEARWRSGPRCRGQGPPIYLQEAKPTGPLESTKRCEKIAKSKAKQTQPKPNFEAGRSK